ncbi:MAG: UDP-N-acetylmuramoyl-tripeptide--D-alanyl-D-alanine ligase [Defluviitaleaceae bacterium]|nr:UDP-N-acetylmuramoyl-tripeptide--D-alanyl-D-alanine ligase [Defluviitaleaceae bacterium]
MNLSIQEIASASGGRILGEARDAAITSVSTHTQKIQAGALFVPTVGENVDGHDYIQTAAKNGAVCAFTEKENLAQTSDIPLIYVASTRRALMDLAGYYRRKHNIKVVAVTGSAGKTTTKDMVANILEQRFKTKKTIGNFNNDIGLPLSIFQLEPGDEALVLEMGMNHAGEIHELSLIGAPDIAIITHIGDAHIENFENREGILHAKLEIIDGLRPGGTVILNGDDPLLTSPASMEKTKPFTTLYPSQKSIISAETIGLSESRCSFNWEDKTINLTVPIPGAHMVMNALLATVAGLTLGATSEEITKGFDYLIPAEGRLKVETAGDMTIINDAYNANPAAMQEAIKILCAENQRKVAILGDMNELGHVAEARHREVGQFAKEAGVSLLISIGELASHIHQGFADSANSLHFPTVEAFLAQWQNHLKPGDVVLIKASRGMEFEKITNSIM